MAAMVAKIAECDIALKPVAFLIPADLLFKWSQLAADFSEKRQRVPNWCNRY
jgi:hypothetical protein